MAHQYFAACYSVENTGAEITARVLLGEAKDRGT